jgi:hypothetical protein
MRLPEAKIKEAIVHPEKLVRQEALHYFTDCYSRDAEVMLLAIKAIETYGRSSAFLHVNVLAQLAQTETTVEWAIKELHREEDNADDLDSFFPAFSRLLCLAEAENAGLQAVDYFLWALQRFFEKRRRPFLEVLSGRKFGW